MGNWVKWSNKMYVDLFSRIVPALADLVCIKFDIKSYMLCI